MRRSTLRSRPAVLAAARRAEQAVDPGPDVEPEPAPVDVRPIPGLARPAAGGGAEPADPWGGARVPGDVLATLGARRGGGEPLPPGVAAPMARELRRDLSAVRVHTGPTADRLTRSVQSIAFTQGSDIYFSRGAYRPSTPSGSHLLAHELAHVGQDAAGSPAIIGRADDPAEAMADRVADRVAPLLRRSAAPPPDVAPPPDAAPHPASAPHPAAAPHSAAAPHPDATEQAGGAVRRRFSVTSGDVNALRSKAGVRKGARTKDTLDKIGRLLDRHPARRDELEIIQSLLTIGALGHHWLDRHRGEGDRAKIDLVETIVAEASRDHAQLLAQRRYVADARAGSGLGGPADPRVSSTPLTMQVGDQPSKQAGTLAGAALAPRAANQYRAPVVDLVAGLGLTEAEILAIKTFTNEDYKYLNPAVAGDDAWMGDQRPALQLLFNNQAASSYGRQGDAQTDLGKLKAEGVLHAGVMMQAVAKLEPKVGTVYRGERLTQREFDQKYGRATMNFKTFASLTTDPAVGRGFATRLPNRKDQTLSVFCQFDVTDARDISMLSVNQIEKEWLVLPGASFVVSGVVDISADQKPEPGITRWLEVHLRQVAANRRL